MEQKLKTIFATQEKVISELRSLFIAYREAEMHKTAEAIWEEILLHQRYNDSIKDALELIND